MIREYIRNQEKEEKRQEQTDEVAGSLTLAPSRGFHHTTGSAGSF